MTAADADAGRTTTRFLAAPDFERWLPLWSAYLAFYRARLTEDTTRASFEGLCHGGEMFALVAEREGSLVGFAHAVVHPTTWSVGPSCYLEDLFVHPSARGTGTAQLLIEELSKEAARRGAGRVYWHTQEFNGAARSLYDLLASRLSFVVYERELT